MWLVEIWDSEDGSTEYRVTDSEMKAKALVKRKNRIERRTNNPDNWYLVWSYRKVQSF